MEKLKLYTAWSWNSYNIWKREDETRQQDEDRRMERKRVEKEEERG